MTIAEIFMQLAEAQKRAAGSDGGCPSHPEGCPGVVEHIEQAVRGLRADADALESIANLVKGAPTKQAREAAERAVEKLLGMAARGRGLL